MGIMEKKELVNMKKVAAILGIVLVLTLGAGTFLALSIAKGPRHLISREEAKENTEEALKKAGFSEDNFLEVYKPETIEVPLKEGTLPLEFFPMKGAKATVIFLHPMGGDRRTTYPVMEYFLKGGFQTATFDQRGVGENPGDGQGMGVLEGRDFTEVVRALKEKTDLPLYAWGMSYGANALCQGLKDEETSAALSGVILDSPLVSPGSFLREGVENAGVPLPTSFLLDLGSLGTKALYGYSYEDLDCTSGGENFKGSLLFFASEKDELISYGEMVGLYDAFPGEKKLVSVKDAPHGQIMERKPRLYMKEIGLYFLKEGKLNEGHLFRELLRSSTTEEERKLLETYLEIFKTLS